VQPAFDRGHAQRTPTRGVQAVLVLRVPRALEAARAAASGGPPARKPSAAEVLHRSGGRADHAPRVGLHRGDERAARPAVQAVPIPADRARSVGAGAGLQGPVVPAWPR